MTSVNGTVLYHERRGSGAPLLLIHADDAAALLTALGVSPATVLGLSSGGVVALSLAARHPDAVGRVIAWEPPAVGVVPGGADMNQQLLKQVTAHLATHHGDYVGAQAMLLTYILGVPVTTGDPAFEGARRNAEPMLRDDPHIAAEHFTADDFAGRDITIALGDQPNDIVAAAASELAALTGVDIVRVQASHEIYFEDPSVLVTLLASIAA